MLFTSPVFLFLFLPVTLLVYFAAPRFSKNAVLLAVSLMFYAWGEPEYVLILLSSIVANHVLAWRLAQSKRIALLWFGVILNLTLLVYFKYSAFFLSFFGLSLTGALAPNHLPLGISFFTFQALSYLIDVYRRDTPVSRSLTDTALYISLFPQLIAGPIVRYHDIALQIGSRRHSQSLFFRGLRRFVMGLAKKLLLADALGGIADLAFDTPAEQLDTSLAWLGVLAFSLQIYFDFSAYSDMAIGLGRMFGFDIAENFRYPYAAKSVRDFWRRWHISLSRWFRDYVYIPLGGNRKGGWRTASHLLIVFLLCGLWHGANWTFVLWGLLHGLLLSLERGMFGRLVARLPGALQWSYTVLFVALSWVLFRADDVSHALIYVKALIGLGADGTGLALSLISRETAFVLLCAMVLSVGAYPRLLSVSTRYLGRTRDSLQVIQLVGLLFLAFLAMASASYAPFIYFRF